MYRACVVLLASAVLVSLAPRATGAEKVRVLFVGGDWKAQLPNFQGNRPLRGFYVKQEVDKAAPGRFDFTLWTSYEFLQYGDAESLTKFDVIVVGDTMGQSVLPRLVKAVTAYVEDGGGFWYCDNHKAFMFYVKERSFDEVLPVEVVPFRAYGPEPSQPRAAEGNVKVQVVARDHPIVRGLDVGAAPELRGNTSNWGPAYGKVKPGATVIARTPGGKDIWVAWEKGSGRVFWSGGVFSNDELSEGFAKWPQFGKFYAQALEWLAAKSRYRRVALRDRTADGTLDVDLRRTGPEVTSKHFGIHGQEDAPGGSYPMKGADLELYKALKLDGTFARTSAYMLVKRKPGGGNHEYMDDGTDIARFDWSKYDTSRADVVIADLERIKAEPVFLYWCPWWGPNWPDPEMFTKWFAASIEHLNGPPGSGRKPRLEYFEIMNEPNLAPAETTLPRYADFFNHAAAKLKARYKGLKFGCGGFNEWTYVQSIIDRCGRNLDWFSRHPYGHTGEAVFFLQDLYADHAAERGLRDLKFIVTEWDFWIYGEPAFDYLMMRWKPVIDHADSCLGTLHYRWREYQEGGYVFGIHGEFDQRYGELPPEWPNPGKDKPITYRYNAWWIMRDCRGKQYEAELKVPALGRDGVAGPAEDYSRAVRRGTKLSARAWAVATSDGKQFNVVVNYGYPYEDLGAGERVKTLKLRVRAPIPREVRGRTLIVSRADCRRTSEEPPRTIRGNEIDLEIELPAQSAVSLTVR